MERSKVLFINLDDLGLKGKRKKDWEQMVKEFEIFTDDVTALVDNAIEDTERLTRWMMDDENAMEFVEGLVEANNKRIDALADTLLASLTLRYGEKEARAFWDWITKQ